LWALLNPQRNTRPKRGCAPPSIACDVPRLATAQDPPLLVPAPRRSTFISSVHETYRWSKSKPKICGTELKKVHYIQPTTSSSAILPEQTVRE
jgi:hypothetical protein